MAEIFDPTQHVFKYKPRGNAEMFEPYFPQLKEVLKYRFEDEMPFDERTVNWDPDKKEVVVHFPVDYSELLFVAVSNFIFGAMEIRGF